MLVRFRTGTNRRAMLASHARLGATVKRTYSALSGLQLVRVAEGTPLARTMHEYRSDPNVLYAEPNYILHALALPSDPDFPQQWSLMNTGQNGGTPGADIHATQAWDITTGSPSAVVAVIDSGIDYTHPDLARNMLSTTFCNPNGTSASGGASSCYGIAPVYNSSDPMDDLGHGTHLAGIIGAVGNNGIGVSGVNWNVKLVACKFLDSTGLGTTADAVTCLNYVKTLKDNGVNIVATNNSWGGGFNSKALIDAITALQKDGILFIAAAGNDFQDNDLYPTYPASLPLPNVISVGATDRNDQLPAFTNFGRHSVHLGAPGEQILSTLPGNTYGTDTGTSMSAPHVTGVAALLAAQDRTRDWRAIKNLLLAGGDTIPGLADTVTGKRLNAYGSMTCSNSVVGTRLQPTTTNTVGAAGSPVTIAYLNINCAQPDGPVSLQSSDGNTVTLHDDGKGADQAAGDGIYTGQFTPAAAGNYTLTFPGGDTANVDVLTGYYPWPLQQDKYSYRTITGTSLNLGDDAVATITSPFPIQFGGGGFTDLHVSSNGTISFTDMFDGFVPDYLPVNFNYQPYSTINTLVAPFWEDLYPVKGSDNNVFWDVIGSAPNRELVIEWRNVESFACRNNSSNTVTFQVVFDERSSNVLFNYDNATFGGNCSDEDYGGRAEIGIEVAPVVATSWGFDQPLIGSGSGILWQLIPGVPSKNPVPAIASVSPTSVQAGTGDYTLTVTGSNFVPQSIVEYLHYCPTTYVSATELRALILAKDIQLAGNYTVDVYNPPPEGGHSNYVNVTVTAGANQAPVIAALKPNSIAAGSFGFELEVDGKNFIPSGSVVQWNGNKLSTIYTSPQKLFALVTGDLLASPATIQVTVNNLNLGDVSNAVPFAITAPAGSALMAGQPNSRGVANAGPPYVPGRIHDPKYPSRFLGWKIAAIEGPDYVQHFLRAHTGLAISAASTNAAAGRSPRRHGLLQASPNLRPPGFQFRRSITSDVIPTSVFTADFNRDGHMDWVVANGGANTLWIYFGNGDGTAQTPVIIPLSGQSPVAVTAADLRGNGVLDLVVAEADSGQVGVLLGNANGTFGVEKDYYIPGIPVCLLVDDFNGDGHRDILVGIGGNVNVGELALLPGDGTGRFGSPVYRPSEFPFISSEDILIANNIAEADLNGDRLPDLVVNDINPVNPAVYAYLNRGDGTFKISQAVDNPMPMPYVPRIITNIALADVNSDGCTDMVDTDTYGKVSAFLGSCDATFQTGSTVPVGTGDVPGGLMLADLNGDGILDVVVSSVQWVSTGGFGDQPGNVVSVLPGDGHGNFGNAHVYRGGPSMYSLAVSDLNGDTKPDVITANQDADSMSVFLNDGSGGFGMPGGEYIGYPPGKTAVSNPANFSPGVRFADIDGDGKTDIVLLEAPPNYIDAFTLTTMLNKGGGQFSDPIHTAVIDAEYRTGNRVGDFAMADFRGTGRPDFVAIGQSFSYIGFAKNNGDGTFTPLPLVTPAGAQGYLAVADFNHDGKLDLAVAGVNPSSQTVLSLFPGNGDGTFTQGYSTPIGGVPDDLFPLAIWVADVNSDGMPDVLVQLRGTLEGTGGHDVIEYLGKGDGTFAAGRVVLPSAGAISLADLNHDGIADIVDIVEPLNSLPVGIPLQYAIYLGQKDGTFLLNNTYQLPVGLIDYYYTYSGPLLGDVNGDGNIDIAAFQDVGAYPAASNGTMEHTVLQILLGNGDGTFTLSNSIFDLGQYEEPQALSSLIGDGRAGLFHLGAYASSYQIIPAAAGPGLQLNMVNLPVPASTGSAQVRLALPSSVETVVQLSASDPNINVPATVTVPANSVAQTFQFQIGSGFNPNHVFTVQAALNGQTATAYGWRAAPGRALGYTLSWGCPVNSPLNCSTQTAIVGGDSAPFYLDIAAIGHYTTTVQFSCAKLPSWATCKFTRPALQLNGGWAETLLTVSTTSAAPVGSSNPFTVAISDGNFSVQGNATLQVGDFGISVTPATQTVGAGTSGQYQVTPTLTGNYYGSINISVAGLPPGVTLGPGSATSVWSTGWGYLNVQTAPNTPQGKYTLTVTGTVGAASHSAQGALVVGPSEDFGISVSPATQTVTTGNNASYQVSVSSINGYSQQVNLSFSGLPSGATGTLMPGSVFPGDNGNGTFNIQTARGIAPGSYVFTITGMSGSLTHSAQATLVVQAPLDFSGTVTPDSAILSVGQSAQFTVKVNSINSARGAVTLQCLNLPVGSKCSFNPSTPNLAAEGSVTDTLNLQVTTRPAIAVPVARPLLGWPKGGPWPWTFTDWELKPVPLLLVLVLGLPLLALVFGRRRLVAPTVALVAISALLLTTQSCGGGGGPPPPVGPSSVTFRFTVQASVADVGGAKNIGTVTITVN